MSELILGMKSARMAADAKLKKHCIANMDISCTMVIEMLDMIDTLTEQARAQDKWISVDDVSAITATQLVYVAANDIVSQWVDVIEAYVCPEYGGVMWIDLDGEDYVPIITAWMPVTLPTPPKEAE